MFLYDVKIKFKKGTEKFMYVCGVIDICYHFDKKVIHIYKDNGIIITLKVETIEHITINYRLRGDKHENERAKWGIFS